LEFYKNTKIQKGKNNYDYRAMLLYVNPTPGYFSAGGHGSYWGPERRFNMRGANVYSASDFAKDLKVNGWDGKTPIKLYSCDTGKGGADSFAQKLADLTGVNVTAPTDLFSIDSKTGKQSILNGGHWFTAVPNPNGG